MESGTDRRHKYFSYVSDVLVYIVVLNLFVEYVDSVVIDSFTVSILTAIVLKIILDVIVAAEHRVSAFFASRNRPFSNVARGLVVWFIMFTSKFVILEVIDIVFGDDVELGGFIMVLLLVAAMMIASAVLERIYRALGAPAERVP